MSPFKDVTFRASKWYLAKEVDQRLEATKNSLDTWKNQESQTRYVNGTHYQMVEVSITAIQELIDELMEAEGQ